MKQHCINYLLLSLFLFIPNTYAESGWKYRLDIQGEGGGYRNSLFRNYIAGGGVYVHADHERGGIILGYNRMRIDFKLGIGDIFQEEYFASGQLHFKPPLLGGVFTTRFDFYRINNNDAGNYTDDVIILAPQLSWMNQSKSFYLDIGYARSIYRRNLDVDQLTPTIGFAFNDGYDWIQLRTYLIKSSNVLRSQGKAETVALDVKWTHYFGQNKPLGLLEYIRLGILAGERVFAVDGDAIDVFNLSNTQKGTVSLITKWALTKKQKILLGAGLSRYKNGFVNDTYILPIVYAGYSISF
jgi:hypothetical protein